MKENYNVQRVSYNATKPFIFDIHYAKRMPSISYAFGLYLDEDLVGVVTYGSPPSQSLCVGIAGKKFRGDVLELNRLVLKNNLPNEASLLVSKSLKLLPSPKIVVSYADSSQNHTGYIYQATNFLYTGLSDKRTEWRMYDSNKHSKTICETYSLQERKAQPNKFYVTDRPRKHRYLYFLGNKKQKKLYKENLKYTILNYPKGKFN
tara:strand:+ start:1169 stop:1783 length:615 start_codon:yes stop_codon:yes gene_type:complete